MGRAPRHRRTFARCGRTGPLASYLVENNSAEVAAAIDRDTQQPMLDLIADRRRPKKGHRASLDRDRRASQRRRPPLHRRGQGHARVLSARPRPAPRRRKSSARPPRSTWPKLGLSKAR